MAQEELGGVLFEGQQDDPEFEGIYFNLDMDEEENGPEAIVEAHLQHASETQVRHEKELRAAVSRTKASAKAKIKKASALAQRARREAEEARLESLQTAEALKATRRTLRNAQAEAQRLRAQLAAAEDRHALQALALVRGSGEGGGGGEGKGEGGEGVAALQRDLAAARGEAGALRAEAAALREEAVAARGEAEGVREDLNHERAAADRLSQELEKKIQDAINLQQANHHLEIEISKLKTELEKERSDGAKFRKATSGDIEGLNALVKTTKESLMDTEQQKKQIAELRTEQEQSFLRTKREVASSMVKRAVQKTYLDRVRRVFSVLKIRVMEYKAVEKLEMERQRHEERIQAIESREQEMRMKSENHLAGLQEAERIQSCLAVFMGEKKQRRALLGSVFRAWVFSVMESYKKKAQERLDGMDSVEEVARSKEARIAALEAEAADLRARLEDQAKKAEAARAAAATAAAGRLAAQLGERDAALRDRENEVKELQSQYSYSQESFLRRLMKRLQRGPKLVTAMQKWKDFYVRTKQEYADREKEFNKNFQTVSRRYKEQRYAFAFLVNDTRRQVMLAQVIARWKDFHLRNLITNLTIATRQANPMDKDALNKWFRWRVNNIHGKTQTWLATPLAALSKKAAQELLAEAAEAEAARVPFSGLARNTVAALAPAAGAEAEAGAGDKGWRRSRPPPPPPRRASLPWVGSEAAGAMGAQHRAMGVASLDSSLGDCQAPSIVKAPPPVPPAPRFAAPPGPAASAEVPLARGPAPAPASQQAGPLGRQAPSLLSLNASVEAGTQWSPPASEVGEERAAPGGTGSHPVTLEGNLERGRKTYASVYASDDPSGQKPSGDGGAGQNFSRDLKKEVGDFERMMNISTKSQQQDDLSLSSSTVFQDPSVNHLIQSLKMKIAEEIYNLMETLFCIATGEEKIELDPSLEEPAVSLIDLEMFRERLRLGLEGKLRWLALVYLRTLESYKDIVETEKTGSFSRRSDTDRTHILKSLSERVLLNTSHASSVTQTNPSARDRDMFIRYLQKKLMVILDDFRDVWESKRMPSAGYKSKRRRRSVSKSSAKEMERERDHSNNSALIQQRRGRAKSFGCEVCCTPECFDQSHIVYEPTEALKVEGGPRVLRAAVGAGPSLVLPTAGGGGRGVPSSSSSGPAAAAAAGWGEGAGAAAPREAARAALWGLAALAGGAAARRHPGLDVQNKSSTQRQVLDMRFAELVLFILAFEISDHLL